MTQLLTRRWLRRHVVEATGGRTMSLIALSLIALAAGPSSAQAPADAVAQPAWQLALRYQQPTSAHSGRYHTLLKTATWDPRQTAVIVCDMWDLHHCRNAVLRSQEFAPRLNQLLETARDQGATIIHAPSSCMDHYQKHPARRRAAETPRAEQLPDGIDSWCHQIPGEEQADYPIDQSDGGEDDDPEEHAAWAKKLTEMGRNPRQPWKQQMDLLTIDADRDYVSDNGSEIWSILEERGIQHVLLAGVHTNMCVLGRPFGLRQMAKNGRDVVLVRDLTDTMYNPRMSPFVSHFTGTDLIVAHIERHVCPTVSSGQLLGDGKEFRFSKDRRPHVVMVIAEDEYRTDETLPPFAVAELGKDYRVSLVFGSDTERHELPGWQPITRADLVLVSVRRRAFAQEVVQALRAHAAAGKPVVGIRTASHAFSLRDKQPPANHQVWEEFDAQVFGGNYHNHHGNQFKAIAHRVPSASDHPVMAGIDLEQFETGGSLYQTSPLAEGATVLWTAKIEGKPAEPVAWTFVRQDGGRSFYTSLGHVQDFEHPVFRRLLSNAVAWCLAD